MNYNDVSFDWLRNQLMKLDNYAYARLDFRGEPYLVLPEGFQWGYLSKKYNFFL
jgi:hypothetical protein